VCQGKKKVVFEPEMNPSHADLAHIEVGVALPVHGTFTYVVPQSLSPIIMPGKRVLVPFQQRRVTGFILGASKPIPEKKIKSILDVLDDVPLFPASMASFYKWIADYYMHPIGEVIQTALPRGLTLYETSLFSITSQGLAALGDGLSPPLEQLILERLRSGPCTLKAMTRHLKCDVPHALYQSLVHRGLVVMKKKVVGGNTQQRMARYVALTGDGAWNALRRTPQREQLVNFLRDAGEMPVHEVTGRVPNAAHILPALERVGVVTVTQKPVYRDPFGEPIAPDTPPVLTDEQARVVPEVLAAIGKGFSTYLLTGVTGSGKTEVYLQVAAAAIRQGVSVLVLVPEIGLISQTERRFRARFGDIVALLHSGLSVGEHYDQWRRIAENQVRIAVGARSAIFAPFRDLGLIIVDEEHDTSYKQEHGLRYHARDLAVKRAKELNAVVLLGSATPSVQSFYNVSAGKFRQLSLTRRVADRPLPEITIVDLKKVKGLQGIDRFITPELQTALRETLARGEQALLFLNRRGFANFPICKTCGSPLTCQNCDISLTHHHGANLYKCHFCGFSRAASSDCPTCGSSHIQLLGMGTEKVELAIKRLFPEARVARMDRDTTARKGALIKILKDLKAARIDILVGTQMIAKGHDYPNITLVGIICADLSLNFPDFRAGERTFQLLAQVSGRAGRGKVPGRVILQTYNTNHFSILSAKNQDYDAFYNLEIGFRKALQYPPYTRLIQLRISGKDKDRTRTVARELGERCQAEKRAQPAVFNAIEVLGPIESPLSRVAGQYRWQLLLKCEKVGALHRFVHRLLFYKTAAFSHRQVKIHVDVDPLYML
jgi:primosomal protein N' (replication factor Y)